MANQAVILSPEIGKDGLIRVGGIVLGRYVPERGTIEIKDSNRIRCRCRGTCYVEVRIDDLGGLSTGSES